MGLKILRCIKQRVLAIIFFNSFTHYQAEVLGKLPVPGRPTFWITVGQGPIALAVGAGGGLFGCFYSRLSFLFSFSLSFEDDPI